MNRYFFAVAMSAIALPPSALSQTYRYEPAVVTLQGTLLSAPGETPNGKKITFPALQLKDPITVEGTSADSPTEKGVVLLNMVLDDKTMPIYKSLKGKRVSVTGTLFHSDNGNHQTNVLVTPTAIAAAK